MTEISNSKNWLPLGAIPKYKHLAAHFYDADSLDSSELKIQIKFKRSIMVPQEMMVKRTVMQEQEVDDSREVIKQWRGKKLGGYAVLSDNTMIYKDLLRDPSLCGDSGLVFSPLRGRLNGDNLDEYYPNHRICSDKHIYNGNEIIEWERDGKDKFIDLVNGKWYHELNYKDVDWKSFIIKGGDDESQISTDSD